MGHCAAAENDHGRAGFPAGGVARRAPPQDRRLAPPWAADPLARSSLLVRQPDRGEFLGACLGTGATRSVVRRSQAVVYARLARIPSTPATTRPTKFLLGRVVTPSAGTLDIRVLIAPTMYATLRVDVVDVDIPFLMGLDALDALALCVNMVENKLKCDLRGIATPLTRTYGHVYLEWSDGTHYSTGELERLHRHFNHPQPGRLSALLRRAADPKAVPGTH